MRYFGMVAAAAVGVIALAACGGGSGSGTHSAGGSYAAAASPATTAAPVTQAGVHSANTALGTVLVDANGLTLYGRTSDMNGTSSCTGACATTWPPLTVSGTTLPAGLDPHTFSVGVRPDGSSQLRAGKWPLYRFAGDAAPGDTNGEGSGGVWFAVAPTGQLRKG